MTPRYLLRFSNTGMASGKVVPASALSVRQIGASTPASVRKNPASPRSKKGADHGA